MNNLVRKSTKIARVRNTTKTILAKIFRPIPNFPNAKYNGSWLNAIIKDKDTIIRK